MRIHFLQNFSNFFLKSFIKRSVYSLISRNYSATSCALNSIKIFEKSFTVQPGFGTLVVNSQCDCIIQAANPQDYPDANFASVTVWSEEKILNKDVNDEIEVELLGNDDILKLRIPCIQKALCEVHIPFKYDVEAHLEDEASVELCYMESDSVEIYTKSGSIKTQSLKSREVSLTTDCGLITAKQVLQGSVFITANKTVLNAQRLQGLKLHIQAGILQTEIESCYMSESKIYAESGQINIKNLHGSNSLHLLSGSTFINGLNGSLQAVVNQGEAHVHVSDIKESSLIQVDAGLLNITLSNAANTSLEASSPSIQVAPEMKLHGEEDSPDKSSMSTFRIKAQSSEMLRAHVTDGILKLSTTDWFSSLGIKPNSRV